MIDGQQNHSLHCAPAPEANPHPASTTHQWLSGTASTIATALRYIPNPVHFMLSTPGRAIMVVALASRAATPAPHNSAMSAIAAPTPPALPDIPHPPEPAWMAALNDPSRDNVLSREERSPRGGGRGGGGRSSSRGGRGRGGSRSRGGWGRRGGGNRGVTIGGRPAKATGKLTRVGSKIYMQYITSRTSYYTGKKWYNVHGQRVDLHKRLMYTESGKLKGHITTSRGAQYKITRSGNWLKIKTNNQLTISALPKVRQHSIAGTVFRMAMFNLYFNHRMHTPADVHFLFHSGEPYKLSCIPSPEDGTKIDIGYYEDGAVQPPTTSTNSTTAISAASKNATTIITASKSTMAIASSTTALNLPDSSTLAPDNPGRKFVKLASVPKGSSISFAVLNNQNPKATTTANPLLPTPSGANATTLREAQAAGTATPTKVTPSSPIASSVAVPTKVNPPPTDSSATVPVQHDTSDIANNITRVDALIGRESVADSLPSQLVIMNGGEVLKIVPLEQRVSKFLIGRGNDTIMAYSMNGPKTIQDRHTLLWSWASNAIKNAGSLLLPALTTVAALKGSTL